VSIFDLDPAGAQQIDEQARLNPLDLSQQQAGFFTGTFQGLGKGIMRGGAKAGSLPALAAEQSGNDYRLSLALASPDTDVLRPLPAPFAQRHDAFDAYHRNVDFWTPGPGEVGTAGNVLGGLGEMVLPLAAGGGNPALLAASDTVGTTLDLSRQGVDPQAAVDVGAMQGAAILVGFKLPAAVGRNLATRLATGVAGNLAVGRATGYGQQARLEASGDTKAAAQFDPWNAQSVVLDTLMGAAFGGISHLHARGTDAAPAPGMAQAERDAVLTANNADHFANQTMPGTPTVPGAVVAHQRALTEAIEQALRGEPVDVAGKVDLGQFELRPELREAPVDPLDAPNFGLPEAPRTIAPEDPFWQSIPEGPNGRETVHIDTPERQALREQLVEEHFADAQPRALGEGERPIAFVMGGGGASGKGTILHKLQESGVVPEKGAVHIDPDRIKTGGDGITGIPEYQAMHGRGDGRAAAVVHEESSAIAKGVLNRAIAGKYDVVLDRTLGDKAKGMAELQALKDAGYEVRLFGVTLDPKTAVQRAVKRAQRSGRYVPLGRLLKAHKGFAGAFEDYARLADESFLYDNSGETQRLLAQSDGAGGLHIQDEKAYNSFRGRSEINAEATTYRDLETSPAGARRSVGERDAGRVAADDRSEGTPGAGRGSPDGLEAGDRGAGAAQGQRLDPQTFPVQGKTSTVTTERGMKLPVRWAVVDASTLVTSHDDALHVNPAFPAELQPRDRTRAASEQQIARIANDVKPELLAESPKASDGAPVVGADRVVESGNARTIALRRAYAAGKAAAYKAFVRANAARFGLDPAKLDGIEQPVLVRVTEGDYNRPEFARQANESAVAAMSSTEQALADARHLPDMGDLHTRDDGSIDMRASTKFVHGFIEGVGPNERGTMSTADGELSQQGQARIRNAVFARAYGDAELVAMMAEATDANVKNVLAGMLRAAPAIARLREMIAEGGRFGPDITPDLVSAVRKFSQLRRDGLTVAQFEAQGDFFGEGGLSPRARELLRTVGENARAPKRMAEFLQRYVDAVDVLGDPRQADMLAGHGMDGEAALRQATEAARAAAEPPAPKAGSLFNAAGRPTDGAKAAGESRQAEMPGNTVVDGNGQPLTVYHGTNKPFSGPFDAAMSRDAGVWFTPVKGATSMYGEHVIPAHVRLQNPYEAKVGESRHRAIEKAMDGGHDGIIVRDSQGQISTLSVFDPRNIQRLDEASSNAAASRDQPKITPDNRAAYEAIAAHPDLHIVDDNGQPVPAAEFLAAADAEAAAARDTTRGIEAAANCLLRNVA
jgi:predicted ABC-type ATPase